MLAADIIRPIAHQDVKCCAATTLAKKAHEGGGLMLDILKHRINDECIAAGYPSAFEHLPPKEEPNLDTKPPSLQNKWRVCQDFAELNQVTKVPQMPQGDICLKQQNLSSHRWITVFDFANGFYACESNQKISHISVSTWEGEDTMRTNECHLASLVHHLHSEK